ncbi:MAG: outer membrane beta-barrel protein [Paludibacteraceae bacterium]
MKKILATLCMCVAVTTAAVAQSLPQGLGIQIGFAEPIIRLNSSDPNMPKDSLVNKTIMNGLKVGLVYDGTIIKGFGATVGINYTFAAGYTNWTTPNVMQQLTKTRTKTTYNQLELFVDWQYKFEIAKETYIILYTGPSIQCAVEMSKRVFVKNEGTGDVTNNGKVSCFDYTDAEMAHDYQRMNVTWGVGAGFQYQRYFLRGGYDFGLMNPYKVGNFNEMGYSLDRRTRGRLDQWNIRLGIYLWNN